MPEWFEDEAYWEVLEPRLFTPARWAAAAEEADQIAALVEVPAGGAVLDLCCGPGRHALAFARRGFRVTGVDRKQSFLDEARRRAEDEGLNVEWVCADMREFLRLEAFDAAINLYTSFGYFEEAADDERVTSNVYRSLRPGGAFVLDLMGKEILARVFRPRRWTQEEDVIVLEEGRIQKGWTWLENRWIVIRDGVVREFPVRQRLYSAAELMALLRGCGFREASAYGDFVGRVYDENASRLVVAARK
ncbi:MAG: class I SAM-dependent methyltransferase [Candidatus Coatesbacteria bacterium]|nr:MAG: class I SAM-dependent methyltransferase [Candidatus Coatesbacteria bacterium]